MDWGSRPEAVDWVHKPEVAKQVVSARKVVLAPRSGSAPNKDSDNRPEGSKGRVVRVGVDPLLVLPRSRLSAAVSLVLRPRTKRCR